MTETTPQVKKAGRLIQLLSAEVIIVLLLLFTALFVFAFFVNLIFIQKNSSFDASVYASVHELVSDGRTKFFRFITFFGNHKFLIPANLTILAYYLFRKNNKLSVRVVALALSSLTLKVLLKLFFHRPRPDVPLIEKVQGFSFPSGHALIGIVFYGLLIYISAKEIKNKWLRAAVITFLALMILCISFSRIYLNVHYTSDVLAGLAVGFIWLTLSLWAINRIEKARFARKAQANMKEID